MVVPGRSDGSGDAPVDSSLYDQNDDWKTIFNVNNIVIGDVSDVFDYDTSTAVYGEPNGEMNIRVDQEPPEPITSLELYTLNSTGQFYVTGSYSVPIDNGPGWYSLDVSRFTGGSVSLNDQFSVDCRFTGGQGIRPSLSAIRVNGKVLVDTNWVTPRCNQAIRQAVEGDETVDVPTRWCRHRLVERFVMISHGSQLQNVRLQQLRETSGSTLGSNGTVVPQQVYFGSIIASYRRTMVITLWVVQGTEQSSTM